jgi:cell division protein FtsZ
MNGVTETNKKMNILTKVAQIKVVGVGGAGVCILNHISDKFDETVQFLVADTNLKNLSRSVIKYQLQFGKNITKGRGCGGNVDVGKAAALESVEEIRKSLEDAELVVIVAGASGGTGSSGALVVAGIAKEVGLRAVSILLFPFDHELRDSQAKNTIEKMKSFSNSVVVLYNSDLNCISEKVLETDLRSAFGRQDKKVYEEIKKVIEAL